MLVGGVRDRGEFLMFTCDTSVGQGLARDWSIKLLETDQEVPFVDDLGASWRGPEDGPARRGGVVWGWWSWWGLRGRW